MTATDTTMAEKCRTATCRSCRRSGLKPVLDLGRMPPSDALLSESQLSQPEPRFPLEVAFCPDCTLVQILETVPPERLFGPDYLYYSSFSDALVAHARENALDLLHTRRLAGQSLVIELASNDGYLLRHFVEKGIPVLGIDPAPGPARAAAEIGVPTLNAFFTCALAERLRAEGKRADVIIGNNVLAHVADTNGFVAGIRLLLKDEGVAVIEVPYVCDLIEHGEFDTIYHEHLCYFSVTALDHLFRQHGLYLNHLKRLAIHGGSLRLYVGSAEKVRDSVRRSLADEGAAGVDTLNYYADFGRRVQHIRERMRALLAGLKREGKRIAAYGAAAKGTIMLNYIGMGPDVIEYVVDRNVHKQGKYMPGVHIPICDPGRLLDDPPDVTVLLPWNFKDEILRQQKAYRDRGGKFLLPIPEPTLV